MTEPDTKPRTMSVPEAGKILGIGRAAAYEGARTGEIPTIRIGKRILVPMAALERMLDADNRTIPNQDVD